jgi:hypothetical protein
MGLFALLVVSLPDASGQPPCLVQSINYDFPSSVTVGEEITVQTHLTASCVQWPPYPSDYSIRVDLTNILTGFVLSTTTYQVGYMQTFIDQVFINTGVAPTSPGIWSLRVDVYIWRGSADLIVHLVDYAKLPIE